MSNSYFEKIDNCRICNSAEIHEFLNLGNQPPANSLYKKDQALPEPLPLRLMFCKKCGTIQLGETVDPKYLFNDYFWVTGTSTVAKEHSYTFYQNIISKIDKKYPLVLEIASNDGTFLKIFKKNNCSVLGVDPAKNIAQLAAKSGIPTLPTFFNETAAQKIEEEYGRPDIIFARNVLPHVKEIHSVLKGIVLLMNKYAVGAIEFHDLGTIFRELHYDSVYHEHLFYFSIETIINLLKSYKLIVFDILHSPISGGSWIVYFSKSIRKKSKYLDLVLKREKELGLNNLEKWKLFSEKSINHSKDLLEEIHKFENKIIAYGASARSSTLLNFCKIDNKKIRYIIDKNEIKQGLLTPGSNIPVVSISYAKNDLKKEKVILLLAWNFQEEIIKELKSLGFKGKFIIPLPYETKLL